MNTLIKTMSHLSTYAIVFRYPGASATKEDAGDARKLCASVRDAIRQHLNCQ